MLLPERVALAARVVVLVEGVAVALALLRVDLTVEELPPLREVLLVLLLEEVAAVLREVELEEREAVLEEREVEPVERLAELEERVLDPEERVLELDEDIVPPTALEVDDELRLTLEEPEEELRLTLDELLPEDDDDPERELV